MHAYDDLIRRIVSQSGIPSARIREDLERELETHLEDSIEEARSLGHDDARIARLVRDRFGDPDDVAREFRRASRFERTAISLARSLILMAASMLAVAGLILTLQLLIAIFSGAPLSDAFPRLREQIVGFASLVLGYVGLYLEERLFHTHRLAKAFVLNTALFTLLFALTSLALRLTTLAPVVAFASGIGVRMLQRTALRPVWPLGAAVPMAAALLSAGKLLSAGHDFTPWVAALVRWIGLSVACYSLTFLSRNHEAHSMPADQLWRC